MLLIVISILVTANNTEGSDTRINYYKSIPCTFDVTGNRNEELNLGYYRASVNMWIQKKNDGIVYYICCFVFETQS